MVAVVAMVAVVVAAVLVGFSYDCTDAGACGSADNGSLEAAAEERAEQSTAACADEGAFAGTDSALIAAMVVVVAVVVAVVVVVVIAAVTAVAHSVIEVGILISILGAGGHGEETCGQHERGDEYSFSYLHHAGLDAGWVGRVRIFSRGAQGTHPPGGTLAPKSSFFMT